MEKIIFFALVIPILVFVCYLGSKAIMKGFKAKADNKPQDTNEYKEVNKFSNNDQIVNELEKLNDLFESGALTQEEFDKAKKKILNN
tara:strand:+ start:1534 stop:1794 length:261 start_codon:yes stop_codon:yes gene_type:complete